MIRNKLLRVLNSDGNAIYVNDIADAYANWQSLASLFIKDSEHLFTGLQTSGRNVMFYENLAQMLYMVPEENNISGLTFGDIIIVTCAKNYILSRNSQVTFYIWLNTVTERTSENGTQYPAIVEALFSDEQPTGITEFNTLTLTATENIDLFILQNDYRANLLLPQSVSNVNLAQNAVSTTKILDGAVTSAKIADGTISTPDIADGAITSAKIGDYQVTERNIGLGSISNDALQSGSVSNENIIDYSIDSSKIAALAVTDDKLDLTPFFLNGNAVYYLNLRMAKSGSETQNQVLFETAGINNSKTYGNGTNNPVVTINFTSARARSIILSVYNESSNFIQKLAKVNYTAGNQQVQILIDDVSGNYAYSINAIIYLTRN